MYQWIETSEKHDHQTTYNYNKSWESFEVSSSNFHDSSHHNPDFPIKTETFYSDEATFGGYKLTKEVIDQLIKQVDLQPGSDKLDTVSEALSNIKGDREV